jgi:hypothetical protein
MRAWLGSLPNGRGRSAQFETGLRWSPGGATGAIDERFHRAGFRTIAKGQKFWVSTPYGPLREGEIERARTWGGELAASVR